MSCQPPSELNCQTSVNWFMTLRIIWLANYFSLNDSSAGESFFKTHYHTALNCHCVSCCACKSGLFHQIRISEHIQEKTFVMWCVEMNMNLFSVRGAFAFFEVWKHWTFSGLDHFSLSLNKCSKWQYLNLEFDRIKQFSLIQFSFKHIPLTKHLP